MRLSAALFLVVPFSALVLAPAHDAAACGGCFHNDVQQMENTQVSGHRMIFSISKTKTTLWDQIQYVGEPSSFAWVLPIKGTVSVGLSSDALFGNLDAGTRVTVNSPLINCPPPPCVDNSSGGGSFDGGVPGGVVVTAQEVVGPYETVQLSSSDPAALTTWLAQHNYAIPADVQPIIQAYVAEGFGFLALKLVPGAGIKSMRPVRVTSPGASPMLPLRMVAAGVGATTPISLWVLGEGAYVPANFPSFSIPESALVWNWDAMSSNYAQVRKDSIAASGGKGWLIQAGEPMSQFQLQNQIINLATSDPVGSGYGDDMGNGAEMAASDDLAALFSGITPSSLCRAPAHRALERSLALGEHPPRADQAEFHGHEERWHRADVPDLPAVPHLDHGQRCRRRGRGRHGGRSRQHGLCQWRHGRRKRRRRRGEPRRRLQRGVLAWQRCGGGDVERAWRLDCGARLCSRPPAPPLIASGCALWLRRDRLDCSHPISKSQAEPERAPAQWQWPFLCPWIRTASPCSTRMVVRSLGSA
jgi:hypothetical protein